MRLLYIVASPRGARSHSQAIADAFIEAWRRYSSGSSVTTLNVFEADLPPFDGEAVEARYRVKNALEPDVANGPGKVDEAGQAQYEAWGRIAALAHEFKSYDRYVIASPMWNYNLPYRLKHYLDIVFQPGITFMTDEADRERAACKKACFLLARGGEYPPACPTDFQRPYLAHLFGQMGLQPDNLNWIMVEPTGAAPDKVKAMHTARIAEALTIAKDF